jgi:DNA-binding beta-propeller fold protein YncE
VERAQLHAAALRLALTAVAVVLFIGGPGAGPADGATPADPLFIFSPVPAPPPAPIKPPPNGYLNDPCGLAVDLDGNFYVADHYHDTVDVYDGSADYVTPPVYGSTGYLGQLRVPDPIDGPCGLALGSGGELYVNSYHRAVQEYGAFPALSPGPVLSGAGVNRAYPTGVAVDPASGDVYVDERTYVGVYEPSGSPVEEGGVPLRIGVGTLGDGYGAAVSAYPGTTGYVYVPDAASDTVKVYEPATDIANPVMTITGPPGGFSSLRDSAVAVDRVTAEVYVVDDLQPAETESAHGLVDVFDAAGSYEGHLKYEVVSVTHLASRSTTRPERIRAASTSPPATPTSAPSTPIRPVPPPTPRRLSGQRRRRHSAAPRSFPRSRSAKRRAQQARRSPARAMPVRSFPPSPRTRP